MDNQISAVMTATMSKIKEMVDTNTVVGEPITTPDDITLIPLSRVSFAFASGGSEFPMKENKNGVGCGSGAPGWAGARPAPPCHPRAHPA